MDMKQIQDGDYESIWMSDKKSCDEFDFHFVLSVEDMEEQMGEEATHPYNMRVLAVSISENEDACRKQLMDCFGIDFEDANEEEKIKVLMEYGLFATLYSNDGKDKNKLIEQGLKESKQLDEFTFGFAMDKQQNAIGSTGWDFIRGDIMAGLSV